MSATRCPVWKQTHQAMSQVHQLASTLRRLRPMMRHCRRCLQQETCPLLRDFNAQFEAAWQEVMEEWELSV